MSLITNQQLSGRPYCGIISLLICLFLILTPALHLPTAMAADQVIRVGFSSITAAEYQSIEKEWYGSGISSGISLKQVAMAVGAMGLLIVLLLTLTLLLRKAVARRTAELAASEMRFQTIFNSVSDAIFIHDINTGAIVDVNRRMCEMFGYTKEKALLTTVADLSSGTAPYDAEHALSFIHSAASGEPQLFEWHARHRDSHLFWVEVSMHRATVGDVDRILVSVRDISERKLHLQALEHANTCFTQALSSPQHVLYRLNVKQGGYDYMSPSIERITGYPVADFSQITFEQVKERIHPEDREAVFLALEEAFRTRTGPSVNFELEYRFLKADGGYCWLHDSTTACFNDQDELESFYGSVHDVTERKKVEDELKTNEALFREIFHKHAAVKLLIDPADGRIVDANQAAARFYGWSQGELCRMKVSDINTFTPEQIQEEMNKALIGKRTFFEFRHRIADGSTKDVAVFSSAVEPKGRKLLHSIIHDISESKRAEEERLSLEKQLLHAQKLESLGVLAGGIAHDFNNILTAIIGNAELALMRLNPESPAQDNLHRIEKAAARAADLARQMLAYSGKGHFVIEAIDLNRMVEEMSHILEVSISKKAVLRYDFYRHLPAVQVDATQMRQIIMNLTINASEAIGDKSGVIAITTGCQECTESDLKNAWLADPLPEGVYVYLEVADTGCGMDSETLARIFDPFFTTKFTGRGLGMAAVLGIIRGHRGAIKVCSEPDRGSSFRVLLPAAEKPEELFDAGSSGNDWQGSGTVLLVDDEETVRDIGGEMMRELGFEIITATDGRDALAKYSSYKDISLVVMDLTMPHMDGEQCFRELRQLNPDVKVIMSSGFSEHEVVQKFAGKGLAGFVQKPYKISELRDALKKAGSGTQLAF